MSTRTNNLRVKIVHQAIAIKNQLVTETKLYFDYDPKTVIEIKSSKTYYYLAIYTDKVITANRSDIVTHDP